ncbi:transcriptional regulator, TetR family [Lentzea xinjiangensis]|uniref:Transcriptional regulator, TetR family n=1 Tax=Lentzea xinjiangensis TaxID=402600 RepID=A0A1H9U5E8_9PSEU|nr:TetR/AcrR family transcriptional regulator [Lentzea xinjiangensis]SES04458.1 transcriptional regulator, TetR family [Lentzea xinjiangensis]
MVTRAESAAATRRALLDAAAELLDLGGPDAVTLREVGAKAGVTRGAPYRHFADKDSLLTAVASEGWERLADRVHALRTDPSRPASEKLRDAVRALVDLGRAQPHLHRMLFRWNDKRLGTLERLHRQVCGPAGDPDAADRAAGRFQEEFLAVVTAVAGERGAGHHGALLLAGAHGIVDMEHGGHLGADRWRTTADELVGTLVRVVVEAGER